MNNVELENEDLEFKTNWKDECLKTICAFANTNGGILKIGVDDKGKVMGISNPKDLLTIIPNIIYGKLGILTSVKLINNKGRYIIEVHVKPYSTAISYNGKYYKRSGANTFELPNNELNRFLLSRSQENNDKLDIKEKTFDEQGSEIIFDDTIKLVPNEEWHYELELNKGNIITITCNGDDNFYADFCSREEYIDRYGQPFRFPFGSDDSAGTNRYEVEEDDDYYLVIRRSMWSIDPVNIRVKIKLD